MTDTMLGWHFVREDMTLTDGQRVRAGRVYRAPSRHGEPGPITLCHLGYHACERAIDALRYSAGPIVCRVELRGEILRGEDKAVASERKVLWMADATRVLHEAACHWAEQALRGERKAGREPDPASWEAVRVKRAWLRGQASDEELEEAYWAAYKPMAGVPLGSLTAARAAHAAAYRSTSPLVYRAAYWAAYWSAYEAVSRIADEAALEGAFDAAHSKAQVAQNRYLTRRLEALHG